MHDGADSARQKSSGVKKASASLNEAEASCIFGF
jgi:hypothetical protein